MATAPLSTSSLSADNAAEHYRQAPHNIEAEQALLGAILVNNLALNNLNDALQPNHFYEPVHQRIFSAILHFHDKGQIANPVTLKHYFDQDETLTDIGGGEYLARLAGASANVISVADYSNILYDLAIKRELISIGEEVVNTAYDQNIAAPAVQQIETAEQQLFNLAAFGEHNSGFLAFSHSLNSAIAKAEFAFKNSGEVVGVTTGLRDLDKLLGGLQKSDLLILAGRPSMGKTALETTIADQAALGFQQEFEKERQANPDGSAFTKPQSVGFFSLEMSGDQLATRILSARANLNASNIMRGDLSNDEFSRLVTASNELNSLPFFIDDTPALSISALRTRARRLKRVHNLGLLVVDYLQLVRPSSSNSQANRVQEVSEITQGLKAIAKELDIPVVSLSQLSRAVEQREDKRPQLADLRESGSIEQDADVVMFVFRQEYYEARKMPSEDSPEFAAWQEKMELIYGIAEVIVAKQRHGPIGNVRLQFYSDQTRFDDLADERKLPERFE